MGREEKGERGGSDNLVEKKEIPKEERAVKTVMKMRFLNVQN